MELKIATSIEQSKKLLEFGLDPNTYDMHYEYTREEPVYKLYIGSNIAINMNLFSYRNGHVIPAWSLSALLDLMPKDRFIDIELSYGGFSVDPLEYIEKWFISLENEKDYESDIKTFSSEHPIDAVFEMVCWLLENGFIKKN